MNFVKKAAGVIVLSIVLMFVAAFGCSTTVVAAEPSIIVISSQENGNYGKEIVVEQERTVEKEEAVKQENLDGEAKSAPVSAENLSEADSKALNVLGGIIVGIILIVIYPPLGALIPLFLLNWLFFS